ANSNIEGSSESSPGPFSAPGSQDTAREQALAPEKPDSDPFVQQVIRDTERADSAGMEERSAYVPVQLPYNMGDTVLLDNQEYRITELREDTVQLLPNGVAYPFFRAESRERFEELLQRDSRNGAITEYLAPNPANVDQDLLEVLSTGLLSTQ